MSSNVKTGLSLRIEYLDDFLNNDHPIQHFEIIADNWLSPGPHHNKLEQLSGELHFHCVGMNLAGIDPLNKNYINKIKALSDKFKPTLISDHLCFQKHNNNCHHDLLPFAYNQKNLDRVIHRVDSVQQQLGQAIAIENLSYYLTFNTSSMTEADFLNQLCHATNSFILLDLNNIHINELNLKISIRQFLDEIEFKYVKEIHLAGANVGNDLIVDDHGADINEQVLELLQQCLPKMTNSCTVFYERDTDLPTFEHLLLQHKKMTEVIYE